MKNPLPQPTRDEALNDTGPVADAHPDTDDQIAAWQEKDGKVPGHYGADGRRKRAKRLEEALVAIARLEFGDLPGHDFHGNQHTSGITTGVSFHNGRIGTVYRSPDGGVHSRHEDAVAAAKRANGASNGRNHSKVEHENRENLKRWIKEGRGPVPTPLDIDGGWEPPWEELGEGPGHPFRGNQHTGGEGEEPTRETGSERIHRVLTFDKVPRETRSAVSAYTKEQGSLIRRLNQLDKEPGPHDDEKAQLRASIESTREVALQTVRSMINDELPNRHWSYQRSSAEHFDTGKMAIKLTSTHPGVEVDLDHFFGDEAETTLPRGTALPDVEVSVRTNKEWVHLGKTSITASAEFGDQPGHPFRGNQWTDGIMQSPDAGGGGGYTDSQAKLWLVGPTSRPATAPTSGGEYKRDEAGKALAAKTFTGKFGDFEVELHSIRPNKDANVGMAVQTDIKMDGKVVGLTSFKVDAERKTLYADLIQLDDEHQGGHFAAQYMDHVEHWAANNGIDRMTLLANISVGGYAWAKDGYDFANPREGTKIVSDAITDISRGLGFTYQTDSSIAELRDLRTRSFTPLDVAQIGYEERRVMDNGREMWLGKQILINSVWHGEKDITHWRYEDPSIPIAASAATSAEIGPAHTAAIMRTKNRKPLGEPHPDRAKSDYNLHHLTVDVEDPKYWAAVRARTASVEFGDQPGHPFRGNQHTGGEGGSSESSGSIDSAVTGKPITITGYRTDSRSTDLDPDVEEAIGRSELLGPGYYVAGSEENISAFGGKTEKVTVHLQNPYVIDLPKIDPDDYTEPSDATSDAINEFQGIDPDWIKSRGHDGIILRGGPVLGEDMNELVVFDHPARTASLDGDWEPPWEFGDSPGHPFRGNQWTQSQGEDSPHHRSISDVGDHAAELSDFRFGGLDGEGWGRSTERGNAEWEKRHQEGYNIWPTDVRTAAMTSLRDWSYGHGVPVLREDFAWRNQSKPEDKLSKGNVAVLDAIKEHTIDEPLYRGMNTLSEDFLNIKAGDTIDHLGSWSHDKGIADVFKGLGAGYDVDMELRPGAHGLDVAALGNREYAWQQEVIVGDKLRVVDVVRRDHDRAVEDGVADMKIVLEPVR